MELKRLVRKLLPAPMKPAETFTLQMKVIRKDGTVEDLGTVASGVTKWKAQGD